MIALERLSKNYGNTSVFDQADYVFPNQGLICLLGASGSGKSTLLNMLAGFDQDYQGTIRIHDKVLHDLDEEQLCAYRREHIGFVFQEYHLLRGYCVLENVMLATALSREDPKLQERKARQLIELVGLSQKLTQPIENLSGGQKQRVAIARALMGDPTFLLADEPTGALDRENSTDIMRLLKGISKEKLVIVITHDKRIAGFADEIITIEHGKVCCQQRSVEHFAEQDASLVLHPITHPVMRSQALKNVSVQIKRYLAVSLAISIGIFCFVMSLSFQTIIDRAINDFKENNTAYNNGYVKVKDGEADRLYSQLQKDPRVSRVYRQYKLDNLRLASQSREELIAEKYPMPKAVVYMSYGAMPKAERQQIALSPSLARKFKNQINELIGEELVLQVQGKTYTLQVSGIFNVDYDDFFISADIEQELYQQMDGACYSVTYDVDRFEDIVSFHDQLQQQGFDGKSAAKEVEALQTTFQDINRLFLSVSILLLGIGLLISSILLMKLQRSRYKELGLLSALGFDQRSIQSMILYENLLLSAIASILNAVWITIAYFLQQRFDLPIAMTPLQIAASIVLTFVIITIISYLAGRKLQRHDPAAALRM